LEKTTLPINRNSSSTLGKEKQEIKENANSLSLLSLFTPKSYRIKLQLEIEKYYLEKLKFHASVLNLKAFQAWKFHI